jgi:regulator of ribosome biosynthesis
LNHIFQAHSFLPAQFEPTEGSAEQEKKQALALLSRMESDAKKMHNAPPPGDNTILNVRKAIRSASKGQGGIALARKLESNKKSKSKRSKR